MIFDRRGEVRSSIGESQDRRETEKNSGVVSFPGYGDSPVEVSFLVLSVGGLR